MHKFVKGFVVPLVACEAVMILSVGVMYLKARKTPFNVEGEMFLGFALAVGLEISLACAPLCRMIRRVWGTLVGLCVGLIVPIVTGLVWGHMVSYPWGRWWFFSWTSFEAWIDGWVLTIPGGIAGAVVGFLVTRPAIKVSAPPSRRG